MSERYKNTLLFTFTLDCRPEYKNQKTMLRILLKMPMVIIIRM